MDDKLFEKGMEKRKKVLGQPKKYLMKKKLKAINLNLTSMVWKF